MFERGERALREGNYSTAQASFEAALQQKPKKAAALEPGESSIYYQLARAYRQAGRAADASTALKKMGAMKKKDSPDDTRLLRKK